MRFEDVKLIRTLSHSDCKPAVDKSLCAGDDNRRVICAVAEEEVDPVNTICKVFFICLFSGSRLVHVVLHKRDRVQEVPGLD